MAPGEAPICGNHNVQMRWKEGVSAKTGRSYAFWSCSMKMPNGDWCNYKVPEATSKTSDNDNKLDKIYNLLLEIKKMVNPDKSGIPDDQIPF